MMAIPIIPYTVGSVTGIAAATLAPTAATDGFATNNYRFINFWVTLAGFVSVDVTVHVYHPSVGWVLYTDLPLTTILSAVPNNGSFIQLETRGVSRVAMQVNAVVGAGTVAIIVEGMTY